MPTASDRPTPGTTHMVEVLDRVLDRGIVIDADIRVSLVGLTLAGIEARIVVAAIETYLEYADSIGGTAPASWLWAPEPGEGDPTPEAGEEPRLPHRLGPFLTDEEVGST